MAVKKNSANFLLSKSDLLGVIYNTLGVLLAKESKNDSAAYQNFLEAARRCERCPGSWNNLGVMLLRFGKAKAAIQPLRNAVRFAAELISGLELSSVKDNRVDLVEQQKVFERNLAQAERIVEGKLEEESSGEPQLAMYFFGFG